MAVGDRDAYFHIDTKIVDELEKQIREHCNIVTRYDVPFGAGYAVTSQGKKMTIYIDRRVPEVARIGRKDVNLFRYWICHEFIEKSLETPIYLKYLLRHQVAERFEESALKSDGVDVKLYDSCCDAILDSIYKIGCWEDCPPDIDLTPYRDTGDPCLKQMYANGKKLG